MTDVNRRDAVRLAAVGLGLGVGLVAPDATQSQAQTPAPTQVPPPTPSPSEDWTLEQNYQALRGFMMVEQATTQLPDGHNGRELKITSAHPHKGEATVFLRSQTLAVFRADAEVDDFTRGGGVYWQVGPTQGRTQLRAAGLLILVIRDAAGLVRWYSLEPDLRC